MEGSVVLGEVGGMILSFPLSEKKWEEPILSIFLLTTGFTVYIGQDESPEVREQLQVIKITVLSKLLSRSCLKVQ